MPSSIAIAAFLSPSLALLVFFSRAQIALLAVDGKVADITAVFGDVLRGVDEHPAGAGGGITDAHALGGSQELDDELDDRARGVELAALLAGIVGKAIDEVLIGIAKDVAGAVGVLSQVRVAQVKVGEVVEEAVDDALAVGGAAEL